MSLRQSYLASKPNNSFKPRPLRGLGLTQVLDRRLNYNVGCHALGVLGKAQPPDLFSLERRAALRRSPRFSIKFIGLRARLLPTRIWQWFAESHAGAHAPPCGSLRACVQPSFAGILWRALTCSFNNRLVWSNNSFKPTVVAPAVLSWSTGSATALAGSRRGYSTLTGLTAVLRSATRRWTGLCRWCRRVRLSTFVGNGVGLPQSR